MTKILITEKDEFPFQSISTWINHLNIELNLSLPDQNELTKAEHAKVKFIQSTLGLYKKYPTLHNIFHTYNVHAIGWSSNISQIVCDSVENIKKTKEYKESNLNFYAYSNNYYSDKNKKKEKNIPTIEGILVSYEQVSEDIEKEFSYLKSEDGDIFHKYLEENIMDIVSVNAFGRKNFNIEEDIKKFLGKELLAKIHYAQLNTVLEKKEENPNQPKI